MKVYQEIANRLVSMRSCMESGNLEWLDRHSAALDRLARDFLPSGSGFDVGTSLEVEDSDGHNKLVFTTSYHRLNEAGMYVGWYNYHITVTPDLALGFNIRVRGSKQKKLNHNERDYVEELFAMALEMEVPDDY